MFKKYQTVSQTGSTPQEATERLYNSLPQRDSYDIKTERQADGSFLATCKYEVPKQEKVVTRGGGSGPTGLESKLRF